MCTVEAWRGMRVDVPAEGRVARILAACAEFRLPSNAVLVRASGLGGDGKRRCESNIVSPVLFSVVLA
eukprot:132583-Pyramimonas_sp.AAC.1